VRVVWFVAGTAAGVYATAKARRAAEALTVDGVHDRLTGWFAGARVLRDEARAGMTEKETELRARLVVVPDGERRQLEGKRHLELAEAPNGKVED
jgi:Family of unknown function (DUF6167)